MKLTNEIKTLILQHAQNAAPNEACGLLIEDARCRLHYQPCANIASEPETAFAIPPENWLIAEQFGQVVAIVHSHPNGLPHLSLADRQMQVSLALPFVLVANGEIRVIEAVSPLRGRVFDYGRFDCGSLVRDAFLLCGIELADGIRGDIDEDIATEALEAQLKRTELQPIMIAFEPTIHDLKPMDVMLFSIKGKPSHLGLYLGEGQMLHHPWQGLSRREELHQGWQNRLASIWRHPNLPSWALDAVKEDLLLEV